MATTDPLDPLSGTTDFLSTDTGEQTTGDASGITSTGYDSGSSSSIDLTPLDSSDVLPDKDYSTFTGGLLSDGASKTQEGSSSVSENLTNLLDTNNKYMQQAQDFANQASSRRGLLNSSMGVGAAEAARIQAALPIAQQDAQTQAQFQGQEAGAYFDLAKGQQSGNIQAYADQIRGSYALRGQELSNEQALQLAREQMSFEGQQNQLNRSQQYQMLIEDYAQRSGLSAQEAEQQYQLMVEDYAQKSGLSVQEAEQQVQFMLTEYGQRGILSAQEYDQQRAILLEDYAQKSGLSAQEAQQAMDYMAAEYGERSDLSLQEFTQQIQRDGNLNELQKDYLIQDYALRETFAGATQERQIELLQEQTDQQIRLADINAWNAENLQLLKGEQQMALANIEGQWKNLYQTNATASKFFSDMQAEITKLMLDVDILPAARDQFIANHIDALESGLTLISEVSDLDLAYLLNFGSATTTPL